MAQIKSEFQLDPTVRSGRRGQFLVEVDGKNVLERKGGLIALLTKRPWPTDDNVIRAIRSA